MGIRFLAIWAVCSALWAASVVSIYSDELYAAHKYSTVSGLVPTDCKQAPRTAIKLESWCWMTIRDWRLAREEEVHRLQKGDHVDRWEAEDIAKLASLPEAEVHSKAFLDTGAPRIRELEAVVRPTVLFAGLPPLAVLFLLIALQWIELNMTMTHKERLFFRLGALATIFWVVCLLLIHLAVKEWFNLMDFKISTGELFSGFILGLPLPLVSMTATSHLMLSLIALPAILLLLGGGLTWAFRALGEPKS